MDLLSNRKAELWHQRVIRLVDQLKARDRLKCRKTTRLP